MAGDITDAGAEYSPAVGLIFIFNLIVGTGALNMPSAFSQAGWLLSLIIIILLAFTSYLTVTFVVECMACANAILKAKNKQDRSIVEVYDNPSETSPLLQSDYTNEHTSEVYNIKERVEMGQMASMFFNKIGVLLFNICLAVYLFGDLAIYGAAVPKSLRDLVCTYKGGVNNTGCNVTLSDSDLCWPGVSVDRNNAYRIFVAVFAVSLGPFVFFNVQKTKYLQFFTTFLRWVAFILMIVLAVIRLASGKGQGHPPVANFNGIPGLFGVCIYSFMCHHSLPSLVTPIKTKSKIYKLFAMDYVLILGFYSLLSFTGVFSFRDVKDLYTRNFEPNPCGADPNPITRVEFFEYFLTLFPVFTLSTNFPIIAITLRNNLKNIFYRESRPFHWAVDKLVFPVVALLPPIALAIVVSDLDVLVGITGSYAGAGVQYVIPALLVFYARRETQMTFGQNIPNHYRSPFKHRAWIWLILAWAFIGVVLVTVDHIIDRK